MYTAFKGFGFGLFTAVWLIYLQQQRGLSLSQATLVDVSFWIAAAAGEIPTGIVADVFGRKTSLIVGAAMTSISVISWALAPTIPLIILAYVFMSLGITFLSGAEDALLYESVQMIGRGGDYTRLVGRSSALLLGATALGSVVSGLLGSVNLLLPFIGTGLSFTVTLMVALTFHESHSKHKAGDAPRKSYRQIVGESFLTMRQRPRLAVCDSVLDAYSAGFLYDGNLFRAASEYCFRCIGCGCRCGGDGRPTDEYAGFNPIRAD